MAAAMDLKSIVRKDVGVQVSSPLPNFSIWVTTQPDGRIGGLRSRGKLKRDATAPPRLKIKERRMML